MTVTTLDDIPFALDLNTLLQTLHIQPASDDAECLTRMIESAEAIARPKALCHLCAVEHASMDQVALEGVTLTSRILRVNLNSTHRAFVFVATCGAELEEWAASIDGLLERFWADTIQEFALKTAIDALQAHIQARYQPGHLSMMNPGSLGDWPLSEQNALFSILGEKVAAIGVRLRSTLLMQPVKSVSGLLFSSGDTFESCQLCPVERCPNRRAAHDPALYDRKYRATP